MGAVSRGLRRLGATITANNAEKNLQLR